MARSWTRPGRPAESLRGALQATELSWEDTDLLRDYLLLRGEISRHKENPHAYEPPDGEIDEQWVEQAAPRTRNSWTLISAFRKGAEQVVEAAYRFGISWEDLQRPDGHERGREWFPALADRLHLGAVIAKCGQFCAYAEAFVKSFRIEDPERHLQPDRLWPMQSSDLVERYNRHLGLDVPQHGQHHHESHGVNEELDLDISDEPESHTRDSGHGLDL